MENFILDTFISIFQGAIGALIALAFGRGVVERLKERRFGGWMVIVRHGADELCRRPVGTKKAEEVLDDESSLSVFLKGVASPFGWLTIDLVSPEAAERGLLKVDHTQRRWVIDLAKNPPKKGGAQ